MASGSQSTGNKRGHDGNDVGDNTPTKKLQQDPTTTFCWDPAWTRSTQSRLLFDNLGDEEVTKFDKFLMVQKVETLGKFNSKRSFDFFCAFGGLCTEIGKDYQGLFDKLNALPDDLDSKLNGKILGTDAFGALPALERSIFDQDLQSIDAKREGAKNRNDRFVPIIVSGSSGAGKTTFANLILSQHLFHKDPPMFCVFMKRDSAIPKAGDNVNNTLGPEYEMAEKICQHIIPLLQKESVAFEELPVKEELLLIIDEMGLQEDIKFIGNSERLKVIRNEVETKIAKKVQIVLAGTGVDLITSNTNTDQEATKVVVKPWSIQTILSLAENLSLQDPESLDLLKTPILSDLGSNARAAVFMIDELKRCASVFTSSSQRALIDKVVCEVAFKYINSNGLGGCNPEERRHVVQVVLKALRRSQRNSASDAMDICCGDPKVKRVAIGLMDFHIETKNTQEFEVTVSPAVTIVLSALMGAIETFTGSWEGFERIGALHMLGDLYVDYPTLPIPPMSLVRSASAFPAISGTVQYKAPCVNSNMVFLNGVGAPHADGISTYRFGQWKKSGNDLADLEIQKELAKMGVMQNGWYKRECDKKMRKKQEKLVKSNANRGKGLQTKTDEAGAKLTSTEAQKIEHDTLCLSSRWMTRKMIQYWKNDVGSPANPGPPAGDSTAQSTNAPSNNAETRHVYPFSQLFRRGDVRRLPHWNSTATNALALTQKEIVDILPSGQKITVVFATNTAGFKLKGGAGLDIRRRHVDSEGFLRNKQTLDAIVGNVDGETSLNRDSVEVKFLICK